MAQVQDFNSAALNLLQNGQLQEAGKFLRGGLQSLMSQSEDAHNNMRSDDCSSSCVAQSAAHVSLSSTMITCCDDQAMKRVSPHNSFGFFNRAFQLEVTPLCGNMNSTDLAPYHLVVMMYNLGLAFHCLAASKGSSNFLRKALRIYEGCFANIRHCTSASSASSFLAMMKLALANNIGHIHSHLFQTERAQECAGYISSMLPFVKQELSGMTEDLPFFFSHSLLFLHDNSFLFAAAA